VIHKNFVSTDTFVIPSQEAPPNPIMMRFQISAWKSSRFVNQLSKVCQRSNETSTVLAAFPKLEDHYVSRVVK
jgi:hypothetical protein